MFVSELNIKEFRGIKSCKKPLKLSNFTILIGRNNSGKSTILEALSLLPDPGLIDPITGFRKLHNLEQLHRGSIKDLLYLYSGTSILTYGIQSIEVGIELNVRGEKTTWEGRNSLLRGKFKNLYKTTEERVTEMVSFIPFTTSILEFIEIKMKFYSELITKKGLHIKLAEFLNECVNDTFSEFIFLEPISLRKVYENNTGLIKIKDLGSGAEKIVKIISILEILNPKLVLIDDFDSGFHPSMIKLFFQWLKEKGFQTVISTHSIDVLYQIVENKPENTTILQLNKSNEDILSYITLSLDELEDLLDANTDPRLLVDALKL